MPLITNLPLEEESYSKTQEPSDDWFDKAQQLMVDAVAVEEMFALCGRLYTLYTKAADDSKDKIADPDAIAYANAYNQALEFRKHGNKIMLPRHLLSEIPMRLRKYLSEE